jgi:general L-amino acid transport system permease protein
VKGTTMLDRLYDPKTRGALLQIALIVGLLFLGYEIVTNTAANLRKQNLASGFAFLDRTSGFDISQKLISYENTSTFGRAFWVGLCNTLLVASIGIVMATALGFAIGLARLSSNWLMARLATVYIEVVRNVPLLLQLLFWYFAALRALPLPLESHQWGALFANRRGLYFPWPVWSSGAGAMFNGALIAVALTGLLAIWAFKMKRQQGAAFSIWPLSLLLFVTLPLLAFDYSGTPLEVSWPQVGRYNVEGGMVLQPEFGALLIGLVVYTAAFIAEIVRSGVQGVPKGQREAALALGLSKAQSMRLVILPLALRIIIPPLTNQYLNLTKNSSLAVAIGYPDLVSVFSGTVLNLSNQAVEVILITMTVYLALSLLTSLAMNTVNTRFALKER